MALSTSPFPGMDPYLESPAYWSDFHARFINYWCEALSDQISSDYEVRIDERVSLIETEVDRIRRFRPDVAITRLPETRREASSPRAMGTGIATLEPITVPLIIEEEASETYIQILHRDGRALVAVLELLSPANKEEPYRSLYVTRRQSLLHQEVHLIELDLLVKGQRIPLGAPYPSGQYFVLVADATPRPNCDVYAWTLRHALPTIPIPLRAPDPPLRIDLAAVFATTYAKARYAQSIDYAEPPSIALPAEDAAWARELAATHA